jgi:hypothetical protein
MVTRPTAPPHDPQNVNTARAAPNSPSPPITDGTLEQRGRAIADSSYTAANEPAHRAQGRPLGEEG